MLSAFGIVIFTAGSPHPKQHKPPMHVDDLIEGLQDGTKLLALLEVLSGERLVRYTSCNDIYHVTVEVFKILFPTP